MFNTMLGKLKPHSTTVQSMKLATSEILWLAYFVDTYVASPRLTVQKFEKIDELDSHRIFRK